MTFILLQKIKKTTLKKGEKYDSIFYTMQLPYRKPGKYSQGNQDPLMTEEKFQALQKQLARLKDSQPQAAKDVARLAEMGDFSENVEYQLAKGRLRSINERILRLEYELEHAEIINPSKQKDRVEIGHTVSIYNEQNQKTFQILGSSETNPEKGIISYTSPIGSALLGKKLGETVKIKIGPRETEYTIVNIQ